MRREVWRRMKTEGDKGSAWVAEKRKARTVGKPESCKWDERGRQLEREIEREEGKDKRGGREL